MVQYIYQHSAWPKFRWEPKLISALRADVVQAQHRLFAAIQGFGMKTQDDLRLTGHTQDIVQSAAIEGESLDLDKVRSSIARRLAIKTYGLVESDHHVDGLVEMMADAFEHCQEELNKERLFSWHACLFPTGHSGPYKIDVGMYRLDQHGPMQVVSGPLGREKVHYEAPPASVVAQEMDQLFNYINQTHDDDLIKSAVAHLWFVIIHPFDDGNGRLARAISDMLLARYDASTKCFYSMASQVLKERQAYYKAIQDVQQGDLDITLWMQWYFICLRRAIETATTTAETVGRKHQLFSDHEISLNPRQKKIIAKLMEGFSGKLTSEKWAKINKVTQMTAYRDLQDLIEKGILLKLGEGPGTFYILAPKLRAQR